MPRTIIAVSGPSNVGKTTSICLAYNELFEHGKLFDPGKPARKEIRAAILEIDGVRVGFASPGDKLDKLEEHLLPLFEADCDVIVCATHTVISETYKYVHRLKFEGYTIHWIHKERAALPDADQANRQVAEQIVQHVWTAIGAAQLVEA